MPKLKKPILLYLFFATIILILGLILRKQTKHSTEPLPTPTPNNLPSINNPSQNIAVEGSLSTASLPQALPSVGAKAQRDEDVVSYFSANFNLSSPQLIEYPNGPSKYAWISQDQELHYYLNDQTIYYLNKTNTEGKVSDSASLEKSANDFINSHLPMTVPINYKILSVTYLQSNQTMAKEVNSPNQANLLEITYQYQINDSPLYLDPLEKPDIRILINDSGVRSINAKIPPQITFDDNQIDLISSDEIRRQLLDQNFSIVRVESNQTAEGRPLFSINKFKISNTTAGHLYSNQTVNPVIIVSGTAPNTDSSDMIYNLQLAIFAAKP